MAWLSSLRVNLFVVGLFCAVLTVSVLGKSSKCCRSSGGCESSCPWNSACSNGQDYPCMERIGGYLNCQDREGYCQSYYQCNDDEAARRSGNICNHFPYYNGGYPMDRFQWLDGYDTYSCMTPNANGQYCQSWRGVSANVEEYQVSESNCTQSNEESNLCISWVSNITVNQKCFKTLSKNDDGTIVVNKICCDTDNDHVYACCKTLCSDVDYVYASPKRQYANCSCTVIAMSTSNQPYCQRWSCDQYSYLTQTFANGRALINYQCNEAYVKGNNSETEIVYRSMALNHNNISGNGSVFCSSWTGNTEAQEYFTLSSCVCVKANVSSESGAGYCLDWSCETKQANYYLPNTLWVIIPAVLGGSSLLLTLYLTSCYRRRNLDIAAFEKYQAQMERVGDTTTREAPKMKRSVIRAFVLPWLVFLFLGGGLTVLAVWKSGLIALFTVFIPMVLLMTGLMLRYVYIMRGHRQDDAGEPSRQSSRYRYGPVTTSGVNSSELKIDKEQHVSVESEVIDVDNIEVSNQSVVAQVIAESPEQLKTN